MNTVIDKVHSFLEKSDVADSIRGQIATSITSLLLEAEKLNRELSLFTATGFVPHRSNDPVFALINDIGLGGDIGIATAAKITRMIEAAKHFSRLLGNPAPEEKKPASRVAAIEPESKTSPDVANEEDVSEPLLLTDNALQNHNSSHAGGVPEAEDLHPNSFKQTIDSPLHPKKTDSKQNDAQPPQYKGERTNGVSFIEFMLTEPYWLKRIEAGVTVGEIYPIDTKLHNRMYARRLQLIRAGRLRVKETKFSDTVLNYAFFQELALSKEHEIIARVFSKNKNAAVLAKSEPVALMPEEKFNPHAPVYHKIGPFLRTVWKDRLAGGFYGEELKVDDLQAYNALFNKWEAAHKGTDLIRVLKLPEQHAQFSRTLITAEVLDWIENPLHKVSSGVKAVASPKAAKPVHDKAKDAVGGTPVPKADDLPVFRGVRVDGRGFIEFMLTEPYWIKRIESGLFLSEIYLVDHKLSDHIYKRRFSLAQAGKRPLVEENFFASVVTPDFFLGLALDKDLEIIFSFQEKTALAEAKKEEPVVEFNPNSPGGVISFLREAWKDQLAEGFYPEELELSSRLAYNALFNKWEQSLKSNNRIKTLTAREQHEHFKAQLVTSEILDWLENPFNGLPKPSYAKAVDGLSP